jgi:DNA repair exonuclease SbcCD ATPase subunit
MRLGSITIEGFRGFTKKAVVDLDANVIILQGPNGVGKTSLLDAILWALTGRMDRFAEKSNPVSLYAREGIARVELTLRDGQNDIVVRRATDDGKRISVQVHAAGVECDGAIAERRLSEFLLPQLQERTQAADVISNVLTRGVYLQQDLVRQFIETDTPANRFQLISEVIGAGAVLELQSALEKSRMQWSRNTTSVRKERLEPLQQELARVDEQIARLEAEPPAQTTEAQAESAKLFTDAIELLGRSRLSLSEAPNTSSGLDRLLKEIAGERASIERELTTVRALLQETTGSAEAAHVDDSQLQNLVAQEAAAVHDLAACDDAVETALQAHARLQEKRLADRNRVSRLATMAQLALDEINDDCPVCQQQHDRAATEHHLRELIAVALKRESVDDEAKSLQDLNMRRNEARASLQKIRNELNNVRTAHQEAIARQSVYRTRLTDLGMDPGSDPTVWLSERAKTLEERLHRISALLRRGETLTLSVIRLGENRRRAEIQQERAAVLPRIAALKAEIEGLDKTHELAGKIIEALRRASLDVTSKQIESVQPLFQRIYSRIDPHPTFRLTQIVTALERGRGLLRTGVSDPHLGSEMHDALPILSSSQLNSFAVSLFLALNLGLPSITLSLVMLDDPLQSLDSINLLGLVDVLRRFSEHRQLIVSTHEPRLLGLLQRKLRPVRPNERLMTVYFDGWTRDGPDFRMVPSEYGSDEVRVLAA